VQEVRELAFERAQQAGGRAAAEAAGAIRVTEMAAAFSPAVEAKS
jgi:hypothetical protein